MSEHEHSVGDSDLPEGQVELSEEYRERLLLAQRTDAEINAAVLRPMMETGPKFWITVTILVAIILWGLYAWGYMIYWGMGTAGINNPVYWGSLHRHLYFLGGHQPCGDDDLSSITHL